MKSLTGSGPRQDNVRRHVHQDDTNSAATIIVGLGNDLLSDDGVGLYVARRLRELLDPACHEILELSVGGMSLVESLIGRQHAVIIDSCVTGRQAAGTLTRHRAEAFCNSPRLASYHTIDFGTALELARQLGAELPARLDVFAIEAEDVETINERCTPRVEAAIEPAAREIARFLESERERAVARPRAGSGWS